MTVSAFACVLILAPVLFADDGAWKYDPDPAIERVWAEVHATKEREAELRRKLERLRLARSPKEGRMNLARARLTEARHRLGLVEMVYQEEAAQKSR